MTPRQLNQAVDRLRQAMACLIALDQRAACAGNAMSHGDVTQALSPAAKHLVEALRVLTQDGPAR